jgi:serine/threonine-protein kinase
MGEVYRARDTRLDRHVALKTLPDAFATDADRVARFQREAKTLASLNHSNIGSVHGLEDAGGVTAIVMEFVDGETLAERIARHPLPLDEALPVARQVLEALEAAHEQGIIHRDLKPANIKLRPDGTVKVLDFGLAKALEPEPGSAEALHLRDSPTITSPAEMTGAGVILGTAAYMSPEQAKGRAVGKTADLWAFGAVLYEMLTGRRAFPGENVSETVAHVLMQEPDWHALPESTPASIRRLLRRCLDKDRKRRLDSARAAQLDVDDAMNVRVDAGLPTTGRQVTFRRRLPWAIAAMLALALLAAALPLGSSWRRQASLAQLRLHVTLGTDAPLASIDRGSAAILSPNGEVLAFVAQPRDGAASLHVRHLDQLEATRLAGTEGAHSPFFSPDGEWIAFFADAKLKKVALSGSAPITVCDTPDAKGGTWSADGWITFAPFNSGGLLRVASSGGVPTPLTTLSDDEVLHGWPQMLPDGNGVLYTSNISRTNWDDATIVVQPLPAGTRKIIQRGGFYARYLPSGHIIYVHRERLFAIPFDLERLEVKGPPVNVLDVVASSPNGGSAQFSAADTGTFVYQSTRTAVFAGAPIEWMNRAGHRMPLRATPANWGNPRFSPDGTRLAIEINDGKQQDVWVYEWATDRPSRLTSDAAQNQKPIWTPDGRRIVFWSNREKQQNLYWRRADGTGDVERLTHSEHPQSAASWHPHGRILAFQETRPQTGADLMTVAIEGDEKSGWKPGTPKVFLSTPAMEREPVFSPDGKWIAYQANDRGRFEIYVRPFPGPGGMWQVSTAGGITPTWSRTSRELLYRTPENQLMVAAYTTSGDSFRAEKPTLWADGYLGPQTGQRSFDLHPDGQRVAVSPAPSLSQRQQDRLVFVFNFFQELRRLAPNPD